MLVYLHIASKKFEAPFWRLPKPFSFSLPCHVCKWCFDNFIIHWINFRFVIGTTVLLTECHLGLTERAHNKALSDCWCKSNSLFHKGIQGNLEGESRNLSEVISKGLFFQVPLQLQCSWPTKFKSGWVF